MNSNTTVKLFDANERALGTCTVAKAAVRMHITEGVLLYFLELDGYYLVDTPEVIEARGSNY